MKFGLKALADIYIDDKAKKFTNWGDINKNILEKKESKYEIFF